ncbi:hypothetical protein [Sphingomonas sp.]|uniref:hypothetical protein n=1 Tax=Sphingomonas sp. TaxID=28214 RepID=UPI003B003713
MHTHRATLALAAALSLPSPASALQTADDLLRQAREFNATVEASINKSAFCKGYVGRTVVPASFDALARRAGGTGARRGRRGHPAPAGRPVALIDRNGAECA